MAKIIDMTVNAIEAIQKPPVGRSEYRAHSDHSPWAACES
jgi:hypothetical protein